MKRPSRLFIALAFGWSIVAPLAIARGQTAVFAGAVVRDTLSHGISGALVSIPALNRSDTTDAQGEFKMTGLPPGRYAALIRSIGFRPLVDTILLVNGGLVDREYVLDANPTVLDSVRVKADRVVAPSARMIQFEEHRKSGLGHFIPEAELRKAEGRRLGDIITSMVPGIRLYRPAPKTRPTMEYLSSGRGACNGPAFQCNGAQECPVTLFVDGVLSFNAALERDVNNYPDMSRWATEDYAGVEYYAGGGSLPLQYNMTSAGCGVLVLWHREK